MRFGPAMTERARCAGLSPRVIERAGATLLLRPSAPSDIGHSRAFDVDARDRATVSAFVTAMRGAGARCLLELDEATVGAAEEAHLASLGLSKQWSVVGLERSLASELPEIPDAPSIRDVAPSEAEAFAELVCRAFGFEGAFRAAQHELFVSFAELGLARCFVADVGGVSAAVGTAWSLGDLACIDGAGTLPERRGLGCQTALLAHRLRTMRALGASTAISRTTPGSASQRNLERAGFRVAAERVVWGEAAR